MTSLKTVRNALSSKIWSIFTRDGGNKIASDHNLDLLTKLPIDPRISIACDAGADLSQFSYLLDTIKLP